MTGEGSYALPYVISISLILVVEMVAGFLSNMLVLLSYHVNKQFQQNASDLIITNMNLVDLVICIVSIPLTLIVIIRAWHNPFVCYMHEATISFASVASALNVLVISLDRHDKITNPLKRRISIRNVKWIIGITWVLSAFGFVTPFVGLRGDLVVSFYDGNHSQALLCYEWFEITRSNNYYELYHVPIFFLATVVMMYAYYSIVRVTRVKTIHNVLVRATTVPFHMRGDQNRASSSGKPIERENTPNSTHRDPEKRVSRTTTTILLTFITCWGPHTAISIVILVKGRTELYDLLEWWFAALAYTTILMHPILYVFMRRNFRRAFGNSCLARLLCRNRVAPGITPTQSNHRPAKTHASKRTRVSAKTGAAELNENKGHHSNMASPTENQDQTVHLGKGKAARHSTRIEKKRKGNIAAPPSALFVTLTTGLDQPAASDNFRGAFTHQTSMDDVKAMYVAQDSMDVQNVEENV
ncbi:G-protein coupled receptor 22-like [Diadema antillarum]|uniref:G-protein coupled receptor 22-like n=1 Tax=Diadema antillarum TaxID=105358 RepID=UPI003A8C3A89